MKDSTCPEDGVLDVVREAAQGHLDAVRDYLLKHPEKVSLNFSEEGANMFFSYNCFFLSPPFDDYRLIASQNVGHVYKLPHIKGMQKWFSFCYP